MVSQLQLYLWLIRNFCHRFLVLYYMVLLNDFFNLARKKLESGSLCRKGAFTF